MKLCYSYPFTAYNSKFLRWNNIDKRQIQNLQNFIAKVFQEKLISAEFWNKTKYSIDTFIERMILIISRIIHKEHMQLKAILIYLELTASRRQKDKKNLKSLFFKRFLKALKFKCVHGDQFSFEVYQKTFKSRLVHIHYLLSIAKY